MPDLVTPSPPQPGHHLVMPTHLTIGFLVILLALGAFGVFTWIGEHDARIKAEATSAAQTKVIATADEQKHTIAENLKDTLTALEASRNAKPTPQQIILDMSKAMPNLPAAPVVQHVDPPQSVPGTTTQAKPPDQGVVIPSVDLPAFHQFTLDCQTNAAKLNACQLTAAQDSIRYTAMETRATTAETALKGGTWFHRLKANSKWLLIGGVLGGGLAYGATHK